MLKITRECPIDKHIFPEDNKSSKCLNCPSINVVNNKILPIVDNYEIIHESDRYDGRNVWGLLKKDKETLFFIHGDKFAWDEVDGLVFALPYHAWSIYKIPQEDIEKLLNKEIYANKIENKEFIGYKVEQLNELFLKEWYCYYDWSLSQQESESNIYTWNYDDFDWWLKMDWSDMQDRWNRLHSQAKVEIV